MNLHLGEDNYMALAEAEAEALRLSQRSSVESSSSNHHHILDAAESMGDSSFLVSDDEDEISLSSHQSKDYSPIPVRSLQRHRHNKAVKTAPTTPSTRESKSKKILLPCGVEGTNPLGMEMLHPRNGNNGIYSSNLQQRDLDSSLSLCQQNQKNLFSEALLKPATSTAIASTLENASSKRVTFSQTQTPSPLNQDQGTMTMLTTEFLPSRRTSAMRTTRSQAIAISKKKNGGRMFTTDPNQDQDYYAQEDESYNEKLYDSATWRMYHRIVEHRQSQRQHRIDSAAGDAAVSGSDSSAAASHQESARDGAFSQTQGVPVPPGFAAQVSSSSTVASTTADDEIFEMEL